MTHAPPGTDHESTRRLSTALLVSVSALVVLCAKKAKLVKKKLKAAQQKKLHSRSSFRNQKVDSPRSPLGTPKQLLATMSNKAMSFIHRKHGSHHDDEDSSGELEFGDGGVWQRTILMGDKCQPLDFSGVIYYDESGKQINELPPRSPRATPLPGYLMRRCENNPPTV